MEKFLKGLAEYLFEAAATFGLEDKRMKNIQI
jgi:hypothetical protein